MSHTNECRVVTDYGDTGDEPFYCAACSGHGTSEHGPGCPYDDDPVGVLTARVDELEAEARRLAKFHDEKHGELTRYAAELMVERNALAAELARWKAAWPDPDEYAAALRKEAGKWNE